MGVTITGTGSVVPQRSVDNAEIAQIVDTSDEWIVARTGIRSRRYATEAQCPSDLGAAAARMAMHRAGVGPSSIDFLLVATSSPDYIQPSTACVMQPKAGLAQVPALDVNAVCTGFTYALSLGDALLRSFEQYRRILVVGAEVYSRFLDYGDRTSSVFFGDGAGAVVLERCPDGFGILGHELQADGQLADVVGIDAGGSREPAGLATVQEGKHLFHMDGRRVWEFATTTLPQVIKQALGNVGLDVDDVDMFILHQANARLINACLESLGVPASRSSLTVTKYGNTAAASVPITLDEAVRTRRVTRGDVVVLASVGGGMTAGAVVMRWT